jgi:hypothetical protein
MSQGVGNDERAGARPRYVVPVIAVGFLLTLMVWILVSPGHAVPARSPRQSATSHVQSTSDASSSDTQPPVTHSPTGSTSPSDLDQSVPDSPPAGTSWTIVDTVALPSEVGVGPSSVTNGIPSGFVHSPTGALIAMVQIDFRHLIEPNFIAVTAADVANTPGRAKFFDVVKAGRLTNPANPAPGTYLQLAGFEFVSYTSSTAVIQLLTARLDGSYQVSTLTVAWDGTDWQLVLQPDGTDSPNQQIVSSAVGFVLWGGV